MSLKPQAVPVNFALGLDQKTDPNQVPIGKFLALQNSVFTKAGLLQKRYGFGSLTLLPDTTYTYLTTLNGNLTAVGVNVAALDASTDSWVTKGSYTPLSVSTLPLIRNSVNQTQCDSAIAPNGLVCTVYTQTVSGSSQYLYAIANGITGQNIIAPTLIPAASGGTITGSPRVFVLGVYFVVAFTNVISATDHLQYIAISSNNPSIATSPADIFSSYVSATTVSWDGAPCESNLTMYFAANSITGGQSIKVCELPITSIIPGNPASTPVSFTGANDKASILSMCIDQSTTTPQIYVSFYFTGNADYYVLSVGPALNVVFNPVAISTSNTILNLASAAQNGVCTLFSEVSNAYSYDSGIPSHYVNVNTISSTGTASSTTVSARSVGLASKAFLMNSGVYYLGAYFSSFQPTYFLINGSLSTSVNPQVVGKLAYENGGGYLTLGLPSVYVSDNVASVSYLYKDLVQALTTLNNTQQTTTGGVYSQTGINLASFTFGTSNIASAEIASNLQLSGGFLWNYDGYLPVENDFFLYPDNVEVAGSGTSGSMTAQQYFYQVTYEWGDNQGNLYKSAPSIPVTVTLTSDTSVAVSVPTLRLTYKIANPLKIVIYRWSTAQQTYHQVTSISAPIINDTTVDSITYTDTLADSSIVGNNIIYTAGGVLEDVSGPASNIMTLFDTRLWLVDAEDPNLLWYSKQVIQNTPVEMSDLLTYYVAPTTGAQGSTGPVTALAPMDDKLIIFKKDAIYYINGTGPDNTGLNSQYPSTAIFIASSVGCTNAASIALTPNGLMFQSDKGIWLLGRDLSTQYIGAPVENYNSYTVTSGTIIPGTNQVRFCLSTNTMLMYDYYFQQWGTFNTPQAVSSTLYQGLHTLLSNGETYQETPKLYLDANTPVTLSFQTSWIQLTGLQGFQRAYEVYLLGTYITPHKLNVQVAYDYNNAPIQSDIIQPDNYDGNWGSQAVWGSGDNWGGPGSLEQWRVFFQKERCMAVSLLVNEIYDPTLGVPAGAGLTLSGLNFTVGVNKTKPMLTPTRQVG